MIIANFNKMMVDVITKKTEGKYNVKVNTVIKNNDCELTGILISDSNNSCVPCIYLENYYKPEVTMDDIPEIAEEIIRTAENNKLEIQNFNWISNWDDVKNKIFCKFVNTERNRKLIETIPHREYLNLSIVYYVDISDGYIDGELVQGTSMIRNEHLKIWGTSEEDLYATAVENISGTGTFKSMQQIIMELVESEDVEEIDDIDLKTDNEIGMYVITNTRKIFGASAILDNVLMIRLEQRFKEGFYILPSSVHELIIVPNTKSIDVKSLNEMVIEVNETAVTDTEFLADTVYFYDSNSKRISIAA